MGESLSVTKVSLTVASAANMAPELPPSGLIVLRAFETRPRDLLRTSSKFIHHQSLRLTRSLEGSVYNALLSKTSPVVGCSGYADGRAFTAHSGTATRYLRQRGFARQARVD